MPCASGGVVSVDGRRRSTLFPVCTIAPRDAVQHTFSSLSHGDSETAATIHEAADNRESALLQDESETSGSIRRHMGDLYEFA